MGLMGVIDRKGCYNSDPGGNCKLQGGGGGGGRDATKRERLLIDS